MAFQYNHYYEIYNGGKYVNLNGDHENNVVNNGEKVTMYARTNNPDQRWALERYGSDNQVRIVLQRGGGWYALNYNTENTNCIVWHLNSAADKDTVITLEPAVSFGGVYRLKLAQRNLYLTVVGSSLKWMAFTNEKDQIFSFVEPGANPESTKDEIDLPTNRTYNWSQFTSEVMNICGDSGCSLTCLLDIANIFGPHQYSANDIYQECKWSNKGLLYWKIPSSCAGEIKADGYNPSGTRNVFAVAKAQIQANNPIIIKLKSNSTTHFVVGVGYTGNGASTSELIVLDPGTGSKYTLQEAMNRNSMTTVVNYILTKRN